MKTVNMLNVQHQIPFETIDETGVLPLKILYARGSILNIARCRLPVLFSYTILYIDVTI